LIGTNEAGKSNVLLPLWKLNPAKDGAIEPIPDYPRFALQHYQTDEGETHLHPRSICSDPSLAGEVATLLKMSVEKTDETIVSRDLDGGYYVEFPKAGTPPVVAESDVRTDLEAAVTDIEAATLAEGDEALKASILAAIESASAVLEQSQYENVDTPTRQGILRRAGS